MVGGFNPSEKYESAGTTIPNGKKYIHVPNQKKRDPGIPAYCFIGMEQYEWYAIWTMVNQCNVDYVLNNTGIFILRHTN